jgi:hypothetical protein
MESVALVVGSPLPPEAIVCLQQNGFLSAPPPPPAPPPGPDGFSAFTPLTPVQGQICAALTHRPLNPRQTELLAIYWRARSDQEPALSIEEAARRLVAALGLAPARAPAYVRGALRSFGRRLLQTLDRLPLRIGRDRLGDGVADEIPLLALLTIETGPTGETRHRLTDDGAVAVEAALGLTTAGQPAGGLQTGDPALDDPDAIVAVPMTRLAAALLLRVQKSLGLSLDATVKWLTAQAGAG